MNHAQLLIDNISLTHIDHRLRQCDVDRPDRMNWESVQRILFPEVRVCLQKINSGEILPKENVSGIIAYLEMTWRYIEIFYSLSASLVERIKHAS